MKGGTLQIAWHGSSDPVLTLHFHPASGLLATGGADHDIKLWSVCSSDDNKAGPTATYQASLSYHTAAVNVLRFSPAGDQLASGADGGELLIWRYIEGSEIAHTWKVSKSLRFHVKDVLDLEWSSDGTFLITGSVDNSVLIWDLSKGVPHQIIKDHLHYVQGVTWDPAGEFIASISGDRTCRVYSNKKQYTKSKGQDKHSFTCLHVLLKAEQQKKETKDCETESKEDTTAKHHLFHDETLPSFFRRLAWSPDGSFLLVPAGLHKFAPESSPSNTTYIISRKDLSRPALQLPAASKATVAVCFCPLLFTLRSDGNLRENESSEFFKLPYRLVFAVATLNSLFIYDTQNACPLGVFAGLHYAAITDITWSSDGKFLAVSSQDGFCSLVSFDDGELGEPIPFHEIPSHIAKNLPQNSLPKINKGGESIEKKRESEKVEKEEDVIDDTRQSPTTKTPEKIMTPLDNIVVIPPFPVEEAKSEQPSKLAHNADKNSEVATISTIPRLQKRRITPMCISGESTEKKRGSEKVEKEEDAIADTRQSPTTKTPEKMRTPLDNFATPSPPFPVEEAAKSDQSLKLIHIVDKPSEVAAISTRPQKQRRITPMCISGESTEKKQESEVEKEDAIDDTRQSPTTETLEKMRTPLDNTVATLSPFPIVEAANSEQPLKLMHVDKNSEVAPISTIPRPQKQRRITPMCISEAIKPSSECPIAPEAVSSERRV